MESQGGISQPSTLFRLLPDDILFRLWSECDSQTRYTQLVSSQSIFEKLTPQLVDRLTVHSDEDAVHIDGTFCVNYVRGLDACESMIKRHGALFSSLELRFLASDTKERSLTQIALHCTSLMSMYVRLDLWDDTMRALFEVVGCSLEELDLESFEKKHTELAVTTIASSCTNLKSFTFSGSGVMHLAPIWFLCGSCLEQVAVRARFASPGEWSDTLRAIGQNCRGLNYVVLSGLGLDGTQVADLLISYGDQLKEFMVSKLDVERALHVVEACRRLEKCVLIELDQSFRRMDVLGYILAELFVYVTNEYDEQALSKASAQCSELTKLVVECTDRIRYVPALFSSPFKYMEAMELDVDMFRITDMNVIADATGNLRRISIDGAAIEENEEELFERLAKKNPRLQNVSLSVAREGFTFEQAMQDDMHKHFASGIAKALKSCTELESLEIGNRRLSAPFPKRLSEPLRQCFEWYYRRRVRVYIYGARYIRD